MEIPTLIRRPRIVLQVVRPMRLWKPCTWLCVRADVRPWKRLSLYWPLCERIRWSPGNALQKVPVIRSINAILNKLLNKPVRCRWMERPCRSCVVTVEWLSPCWSYGLKLIFQWYYILWYSCPGFARSTLPELWIHCPNCTFLYLCRPQVYLLLTKKFTGIRIFYWQRWDGSWS